MASSHELLRRAVACWGLRWLVAINSLQSWSSSLINGWRKQAAVQPTQVLIAAIKHHPCHPHPSQTLCIYLFITQEHHNSMLTLCGLLFLLLLVRLTNKTEVMRLKLEFVCLGSQGSDDRSESIAWLAFSSSPPIAHFSATGCSILSPLFFCCRHTFSRMF